MTVLRNCALLRGKASQLQGMAKCTRQFAKYSRLFLACRSRQASIVLERYFRFEVSLLSFYACERDGPI